MFTLRSALKRVKQIYSRDSIQNIFREILAKKNIMRSLVNFFEKRKGTKLYIFILSIYSMKTILTMSFPSKKSEIIAIATTANEFAHIKYIDNCLDENNIETISPSIKNIFQIQSIILFFRILISLRNIRRVFKITRYFRNDDFVTACLRSACLGYYIIMHYILKKNQPRAVLTTSNYSADSSALCAAANSLNIPIIYYPHGIVTDYDEPIDMGYKLVIYSGKQGLDVYKDHIENFNPAVVYSGIKGETKPLNLKPLQKPPPKNVGIFLTAKTNMDSLKNLVDNLTNIWQVEKILIRPHPMELVKPDFQELKKLPNVYTSECGSSLEEDINKVELVFACSSSVHLEILKLGVPTIYYENLDECEFDINRIVKFNVVPNIKKLEECNLSKICEFYTQGWKERFTYYDEGYELKNDETKKAIKRSINQHIES